MSEEKAKTIRETTPGKEVNLLALWGGVLLGPVAYFLQLFAAYGLVDWVCRSGNPYVITLITLATLALCAYGAFLAWSSWQKVGTEFPEDKADTVNRTRFMGFGGLLLSALFFLAIVAQEVPNWIVGACVGR